MDHCLESRDSIQVSRETKHFCFPLRTGNDRSGRTSTDPYPKHFLSTNYFLIISDEKKDCFNFKILFRPICDCDSMHSSILIAIPQSRKLSGSHWWRYSGHVLLEDNGKQRHDEDPTTMFRDPPTYPCFILLNIISTTTIIIINIKHFCENMLSFFLITHLNICQTSPTRCVELTGSLRQEYLCEMSNWLRFSWFPR